jgi:hypothetical protein
MHAWASSRRWLTRPSPTFPFRAITGGRLRRPTRGSGSSGKSGAGRASWGLSRWPCRPQVSRGPTAPHREYQRGEATVSRNGDAHTCSSGRSGHGMIQIQQPTKARKIIDTTRIVQGIQNAVSPRSAMGRSLMHRRYWTSHRTGETRCRSLIMRTHEAADPRIVRPCQAVSCGQFAGAGVTHLCSWAAGLFLLGSTWDQILV